MGLSLLADWMVDQDIANGKLVNVLPSWMASGVQAIPTQPYGLSCPPDSLFPQRPERLWSLCKNKDYKDTQRSG